jgi:hypothetical protein
MQLIALQLICNLHGGMEGNLYRCFIMYFYISPVTVLFTLHIFYCQAIIQTMHPVTGEGWDLINRNNPATILCLSQIRTVMFVIIYSKNPLYCPSIHRQTRVSPRISAVPFSVCSNNPVKMPNSHIAIRHDN